MLEAFRSVEDIYGLTTMFKRMPKSSSMATYYAKLIEILWISSSHSYHAYAWFKLFQLQKSFNKNLSQNDLQLIASAVLLAALSAPPYDHSKTASHLELEHERERNARMYNLIGLNIDVMPERREVLSQSTLLADLLYSPRRPYPWKARFGLAKKEKHSIRNSKWKVCWDCVCIEAAVLIPCAPTLWVNEIPEIAPHDYGSGVIPPRPTQKC